MSEEESRAWDLGVLAGLMAVLVMYFLASWIGHPERLIGMVMVFSFTQSLYFLWRHH